MNEALDYRRITIAVNLLAENHSGNDKARAAYLIMRAAILLLKTYGGNKVAADKAYQLADEMVG